MPADRTQKKPRAGPSVPRPGPAGATETHKPLALEHRTPNGIPGLSKLKASIRQTKRFLAKEGLEPGLKIQTQRRLESLEGDLAKAERRSVEMKNGTKYHKVKFFERQKLQRIIKKQQRQIEKTESSSTKVQAAEIKLEHARIMLNYVINFPNTEKYISLFPTSSSSDPSDLSEPTEDLESDTKARLPKYLDSNTSVQELDKPSKRRLEILHEIQRLMESGKLSKMPEVDIATGEGKVKLDLELGGSAAEIVEKGKKSEEVTSKEGGEKKDKKKKVKKGQDGDKGEVAKVDSEVTGVKAGDDFFED